MDVGAYKAVTRVYHTDPRDGKPWTPERVASALEDGTLAIRTGDPEFPSDAPWNRSHAVRDEIDRFRNTRLRVPETTAAALQLSFDALEYYEHAIEWFAEASTAYYDWCALEDAEREKVIAALMGTYPEQLEQPDLGPLSKVKSRSAAKEVVDLAPHMAAFLEKKASFAAGKSEAEKELSVARRRHATAVMAAFVLTSEPVVTYSGERPGGTGPNAPALMHDMVAELARTATLGELRMGPAPDAGDTDEGSFSPAP